MFFSMIDLFLGLIGLAINLSIIIALMVVLFIIYSMIVFVISECKNDNITFSQYIIRFIKELL